MRPGVSLPAFVHGVVVGSFVLALGACRDEPAVASVDGGVDAGVAVARVEKPRAPALPEVPLPEDPVGALHPFLQGGASQRSWCVQIRSVPSKEESDLLRGRIESELELATWAFEAEVPGRGTWYRVCVGSEPSEHAAHALARRWTRPRGELRPYMAEAEDGQASYFVKERPGAPSRLPTREQAVVLLRGRPSKERPVHLARLDDRGYLAAVTVEEADGRTDVLMVAPDGRFVPVDGAPEGDCAPCLEALAAGGLTRRVLGVGDVGPWPGEEVLLEERTPDREGRSTSVLTIASLEGDAAHRRAGFLLGTRTASLRVLGEARAVEADGEPGAELALLRTELPVVDDRLCALRTRAEVLDLDGAPARRLDENYAAAMAAAEQTGGAKAALHLVQALDALGDFGAASRACAAYLARGHDAQVARHCIGRVQRLTEERRLVEATNAAGLLAEAAAPFRAAVAAPFYRVASSLDEDARLVAAPADCESAPLVTEVSKKRLEHVVRLAEVRLAERVNLADLADAVFVTGARDFGAETPVGQLTSRWLERVRAALPARYAAIQAALLPAPGEPPGAPEEAPSPPREAPAPAPRGPAPAGVTEERDGAGGYIRIEVEDDEPLGSPPLGSPGGAGGAP